MAHKIQVLIEEENRRSLTFLAEKDEKKDIFFKHYESLVAYNNAFLELIGRAHEYRQQEEF